MTIGNILIIDDEEGLRKLIVRILQLEGYTISQADSLKAGKDQLSRKKFDIVLCDVKLPDGNGVEFIPFIKNNYPLTEVVLLTAYGNIPDGVLAIKNGALDYLTKGNDNDRLIPLMAQAMERVNQLKEKSIKFSNNFNQSFEEVIGKSKAITGTVTTAKKLAGTQATILLQGETGTGKEVFAQSIHKMSNRKKGPFIAINCSAFSKELLEAEMFGHMAGAFTGAVKEKKGLIEMADQGTLFLDEIGEMNFDLQAKLLRVLESGEFIKLGDTKVTRVSVRIIAATNRNLKVEVEKGHFREDLFYRLNTFTLTLPPLRERKEDIKELAEHFIKYFSVREEKNSPELAANALSAMESYSWNGNIRELRNAMERAVILHEGKSIELQDLPSEIQFKQNNGSIYSLAELEKNHIRKILQHTGNNKTKTAQLLGIGLATLYRKMEEYGIEK